LNPKDAIIWQNLAINYSSLRDYTSAAQALDRAIEAAPDSMNLRVLRAKLDFDFKGEAAPLEQLVAAAPPSVSQSEEVVLGRASVEYMKRNYAEAIRILVETPAGSFHSDEGPVLRSLMLADIYRSAGDLPRARVQYEKARRELDERVRQKPQNPALRSKLGKALAGLGREQEAIRQGEHAMQLVPEAVDALDGPMYSMEMAHIYATLGRVEQTLPLLTRLLETPGGFIPDSLRYDPTWDFLRDDPRFQALLVKHGVAS
jgi:serine/threonine-protein kinase